MFIKYKKLQKYVDGVPVDEYKLGNGRFDDLEFTEEGYCLTGDEMPIDPDDYAAQYFTLDDFSEDSVITVTYRVPKTNLYYRKNGGEWVKYDSGIEVKIGDKVELRNIVDERYYYDHPEYHMYPDEGLFENLTAKTIYGNINSMYAGHNFRTDLKELQEMYIGWFTGYDIVDASNLVIPNVKHEENSCSYMFRICKSLVKAPKILPATEIANRGYYYMFSGCSSLTEAPVLPSTKLASSCYAYMFDGCTSLVKAPVLASTELADSCYAFMFNNCTALTEAPELPATELADRCYYSMFWGCHSLEKAPDLLAPYPQVADYGSMFYANVKLKYLKCLEEQSKTEQMNRHPNWLWNAGSEQQKKVFVKKCGTEWFRDIYGIPYDWAVEDDCEKPEPEPPAESYVGDEIKKHPYYNEPFSIEALEDGQIEFNADFVPMTGYLQYNINETGYNVYDGPISVKAGDIIYFINYATEGYYQTRTSDSWRKTSLFVTDIRYNVRGNLNSMYGHISYTVSMNLYYNMFMGWFNSTNVVDASNLVLPFIDLKVELPPYSYNNVYDNMFSKCSLLEKAPVLPATKIGSSSYSYMFSNCTSLATAPELPATELANNSYQFMFNNCTSLVKAPEVLPATELDYGCYYSMFYGCSILEKAPVLPDAVLPRRDSTKYGPHQRMFYNCRQLKWVKCLLSADMTNLSVYPMFTDWMKNVYLYGTFVKKKGVEWRSGDYGIPSGWVIEEEE